MKMKYDDNEFPEYQDSYDDDYDYDMDDEEYAAMMDRQAALDYAQLDLVEYDLNQRILFRAIKMLESSWFWRFRRYQTQLNMIAHTYRYLKKVVEVSKEDNNANV